MLLQLEEAVAGGKGGLRSHVQSFLQLGEFGIEGFEHGVGLFDGRYVFPIDTSLSQRVELALKAVYIISSVGYSVLVALFRQGELLIVAQTEEVFHDLIGTELGDWNDLIHELLEHLHPVLNVLVVEIAHLCFLGNRRDLALAQRVRGSRGTSGPTGCGATGTSWTFFSPSTRLKSTPRTRWKLSWKISGTTTSIWNRIL